MRLILASLSLLCDKAQFDRHLQVESAEECLIRLSALGAIGLLAPFCDRNQCVNAAEIYEMLRKRFSLWLKELMPVCRMACAQNLTKCNELITALYDTHTTSQAGCPGQALAN